jgi:hypothetical protein
MPLPLLGLFLPSELFPAGKPCRIRHQANPFSVFLQEIPKKILAALPRVYVIQQSVPDLGVFHPASGRCSHGVSITSTALPRIRLESPHGDSSAHGLCFGVVQAHLRSGPTACVTRNRLASPALTGAGRPSVSGLPQKSFDNGVSAPRVALTDSRSTECITACTSPAYQPGSLPGTFRGVEPPGMVNLEMGAT